MALAVYQYPTCSTCRKALAWLGARGVPHDRIDIVVKPPSRELLVKIAKLADIPIRKLFNTAGESYRAGNFKDRIATMTDAEAFDALAADGKLIKRPLAIGEDFALVGFDEPAWAAAISTAPPRVSRTAARRRV